MSREQKSNLKLSLGARCSEKESVKIQWAADCGKGRRSRQWEALEPTVRQVVFGVFCLLFIFFFEGGVVQKKNCKCILSNQEFLNLKLEMSFSGSALAYMYKALGSILQNPLTK